MLIGRSSALVFLILGDWRIMLVVGMIRVVATLIVRTLILGCLERFGVAMVGLLCLVSMVGIVRILLCTWLVRLNLGIGVMDWWCRRSRCLGVRILIRLLLLQCGVLWLWRIFRLVMRRMRLTGRRFMIVGRRNL